MSRFAAVVVWLSFAYACVQANSAFLYTVLFPDVPAILSATYRKSYQFCWPLQIILISCICFSIRIPKKLSADYQANDYSEKTMSNSTERRTSTADYNRLVCGAFATYGIVYSLFQIADVFLGKLSGFMEALDKPGLIIDRLFPGVLIAALGYLCLLVNRRQSII